MSNRCKRCGWTLAESADKGCVPGNCSYRCSCLDHRPDHGPGCLLYRDPKDDRIAKLEAELAGANERAEKHFLRVEALERAMRRIKVEHTKWYEGSGGTGADAIEAVERIACDVMDQEARATPSPPGAGGRR